MNLGIAELDFTADAFAIAKAGCPCPVVWCEAHTLRYAECADPDGMPFYGGVHTGRVRRFKNGRWQGKIARDLTKVLDAPPSPEMCWMAQTLEDGLNNGLLSGPPTKAQKRQARARGHACS